MANKADKAALGVVLKEFLVNPNCLDAINKAKSSGMSLEEIKEVLDKAIKTVLEQHLRNPLEKKKKLEELEKARSELQKINIKR